MQGCGRPPGKSLLPIKHALDLYLCVRTCMYFRERMLKDCDDESCNSSFVLAMEVTSPTLSSLPFPVTIDRPAYLSGLSTIFPDKHPKLRHSGNRVKPSAGRLNDPENPQKESRHSCESLHALLAFAGVLVKVEWHWACVKTKSLESCKSLHALVAVAGVLGEGWMTAHA